jgi:hypothetical protein
MKTYNEFMLEASHLSMVKSVLSKRESQQKSTIKQRQAEQKRRLKISQRNQKFASQRKNVSAKIQTAKTERIFGTSVDKQARDLKTGIKKKLGIPNIKRMRTTPNVARIGKPSDEFRIGMKPKRPLISDTL